MKRNIVAYDVETTGLSSREDYIIQLAAVKINPETFEIIDKKNWLIKPQHNYTISESATEVTGYTKEYIEENGVSIKSIADEFISFIDNCDFLTYNGNSFDIKFIYKDFLLAGYGIKIEDRIFYDSFSLECKINGRKLCDTYKRYTGKELEGAHDAYNDVMATIEVFKAQRKMFDMSDEEFDNLPENKIFTPDGTIKRKEISGQTSTLVFTFGKYKDTEFMKVCKKDPSYIKWFTDKVASPYTTKMLRAYYVEHRNSKK